jgi:hypothetical protein
MGKEKRTRHKRVTARRVHNVLDILESDRAPKDAHAVAVRQTFLCSGCVVIEKPRTGGVMVGGCHVVVVGGVEGRKGI